MISATVKDMEGRAASRAEILADVRGAGGAGTARFLEPSRTGAVTLLVGPDAVAAAADTCPTDTVVDAEAERGATDTAAASLSLRQLSAKWLYHSVQRTDLIPCWGAARRGITIRILSNAPSAVACMSTQISTSGAT